MPTLTAVTWNLQGRHGLDVAFVADHLSGAAADAGAAADVVALQEVQRSQARAVAGRLGWHWVWGFKHWPMVNRAEGAAILSPHRLVDDEIWVVRPALSFRWQRRIAVTARCLIGDTTVEVSSVHLSPQGPVDLRREELDLVGRRLAARPTGPAEASAPGPVASAVEAELRPMAGRPTLVMGDLNVADLDHLTAVMATHGWFDCWSAAGLDRCTGDGLTHWAAGPRAGRSPDLRLDYVLASNDLSVVAARVPVANLDRFAAASDHLPLTIELTTTA